MIEKVKTSVRTFEIVQNVSGQLEGELRDWPPNIQDKVWEALDRLSKKERIPVAVVGSECGFDINDNGIGGTWYVRVLASEIVKKSGMDVV